VLGGLKAVVVTETIQTFLLLAGPILCAVCILTYIVVSLTSAPPSPDQLDNACWGSPLKAVTETRSC
jgi:Na+/proline symporter